jgi:hypothetical protein
MPNFNIKGGTPRFHTKSGKARSKIDDALKQMGGKVEDASDGWETKDD